jgi:hypothetical protein
MRIVLLAALALLPGCATMTYISGRPAPEVAECIAEGWRKSPRSGYEAPVSLTRFDEYYFVGVELHPYFLPYGGLAISGTGHPDYPVWAEVRDSLPGSTTTYHRAYQITHAIIDRVVVECQGPKE